MLTFFVLFLFSDIDECALNTFSCNELAYCENTIGNYTCSCNEGYSGDGFSYCTSEL